MPEWFQNVLPTIQYQNQMLDTFGTFLKALGMRVELLCKTLGRSAYKKFLASPESDDPTAVQEEEPDREPKPPPFTMEPVPTQDELREIMVNCAVRMNDTEIPYNVFKEELQKRIRAFKYNGKFKLVLEHLDLSGVHADVHLDTVVQRVMLAKESLPPKPLSCPSGEPTPKRSTSDKRSVSARSEMRLRTRGRITLRSLRYPAM
eukprot:gnl/Trimastix_PCT/3097.p2 GENE.gnl/Trimastix_PCT/3097~~gnl/Trimastix_PCT/3097.p2  ORF type:complete len:204 (-),score=40.64 gnl/Trimastix_PCT/3097:806-1417(-)